MTEKNGGKGVFSVFTIKYLVAASLEILWITLWFEDGEGMMMTEMVLKEAPADRWR